MMQQIGAQGSKVAAHGKKTTMTREFAGPGTTATTQQGIAL